MLSAIALVTVQFDEFTSKLPAFHEFFQAKNAVWLIIALAVTKIIHEFGHGLTCKHFGGECHEIGVMFLVLTPCLYCNVSDSWMLPSKWQRAAVGAAGMYVELLLASLATFIWWFTHPGMLHYLCLNVMFVSSVSTVLFNANPLLRYDGYYILTDIAEIPNLRQKATQVLSRFAKKWLLGIDEPPDPFAPQRGLIFFACYSVAAFVYRWVVMISILWFLLHVFEPYGLKPLGVMIAVFTIGTTLVMPLVQFIRFLQTPGRMQEVNTTRWVTACGLGGVLLAAVAYVPVPHRVWCTLTVEPKGAVPVYVDVPGMLHTISHRPGDRVEAGEDAQAGDGVGDDAGGPALEEPLDEVVDVSALRPRRPFLARDEQFGVRPPRDRRGRHRVLERDGTGRKGLSGASLFVMCPCQRNPLPEFVDPP